MGKARPAEVVAVSAENPPIEDYYFVAEGGAAQLDGIFVNDRGRQTGISVRIAIPAGPSAPVSFANAPGGVPSDAVGFIGDLTLNPVHYGIWDSNETNAAAYLADLTGANYTKYPTIDIGNNLPFASVAVV